MEAALDSWWLVVASSRQIWDLVLFCLETLHSLLISPTVPCGIFVYYHMVCLFSVEREVKVAVV